ncbi:serine/threonine protein kinase [Actinomadura sp. KC06]|uniref:serine/threonine-protein kinase n=1 Tax=Actinomadura sp. KC06 TaxID=2530369 RepID=UPI0010466A83|nr:serine/threonine-protein kinase [Actinomadura sp. KC06]TDD38335.1 serine/threonine protein kinase [Actinomadura sp. KC06]
MTDGSPLQAHDPAAVGGYRLVARLGEGGQGVVYLAEDSEGRRVAVKCLKVRLDGDAKARERFAAEVAAAKRVAEFCTARVLDADLDGSVPYLVSEFVDGVSLLRAVRRDGVRTGADLERLAIGTATALVAIHQAKVVHRDFKPGNVLLSAQGPRVVDFGISRVLEGAGEDSSQVVGTPAYMAPELFAGGRAGPAVDVFAWGCTVVFAATGRSPFAAATIEAVMRRISTDEPDVGDLRGGLRDLVVRCLDKDPERRPDSEDLLLGLLRREPKGEVSLQAAAAAAAGPAAAAAGPAAGPAAGTSRPPRRARRAAITAATAIGAAGAAALVTATLLPSTQAEPGDDPANPGNQAPPPGATAMPSARPSSPTATATSRPPSPGPNPGASNAPAGGTETAPKPGKAGGPVATFKWASAELTPQLKKTACLYRIRYGNFGNTAFAQVRTYGSGCGKVTVSVYGQSGSFSGTWNSAASPARSGRDGCGAYVERQATSSANHIATGMAVAFDSIGGTARYLHSTGKPISAHRAC